MTEHKAKTYIFKVKKNKDGKDREYRGATRRALVSSLLSLLISCVMLLGSTLAWFTDSSDTSTTKIIAGNLAIDLLMKDEQSGNYSSVAGKNGAIVFIDHDNAILPGEYKVAYLAVNNMGTLTAEYEIKLTFKDKDAEHPLAKHLQYAIVDGAKSAAEIDQNTLNLKNVTPDSIIEAAQNVTITGKGIHYFALVICMPTDVQDQDGEATMDITVVAKQSSAEKDSFGSSYDTGAEYSKP